MERLLLDRSIFRANRFTEGEQALLLKFSHSGKYQIFYSADFIEETLRTLPWDKNEFSQHWDFLYKLNHQFWFKNPNEIIKHELTVGAQGLYYLRTADDIQNSAVNLQDVITGRKTMSSLEPAIRETAERRQRAETLRTTILEFRASHHWKVSDFEEFVAQNAEPHFREQLAPVVGIDNQDVLRWRANPENFPFTTFYISCKLLVIFLPLVHHQLAVHRNDKSDASQLAFMLWTDILVSEDTHFMASAFDFLFGTENKRRWSLRELCHKLEM